MSFGTLWRFWGRRPIFLKRSWSHDLSLNGRIVTKIIFIVVLCQNFFCLSEFMMSHFIYWLQVKREFSYSVYKEHLHHQRQYKGLYTIIWMKYKLSNSNGIKFEPYKALQHFFSFVFSGRSLAWICYIWLSLGFTWFLLSFY
jgi:hypothetical protein